MKVSFITALTSRRHSKDTFKKCFGFYPTSELAITAMHISGGWLVECLFDYIVIEEYKQGIERIPDEIAWFKWNSRKHKWVKCGRPKQFRGTVCFAIP